MPLTFLETGGGFIEKSMIEKFNIRLIEMYDSCLKNEK